jgi:hypothetical protein
VTDDIFGDVIDVDLIEQAARATLRAWLPSHLAHQERRRGLTEHIKPPRSWPTVSDFDPLVQEQLPSVVLVSPGTSGAPVRDQRGVRATWRLEVVAAVAAKTEKRARLLGSLYAAAIRSALVQNPTLPWREDTNGQPVAAPGVAESTLWQGDDHAVGNTERGPRWMGEVQFLITVRDVVDPAVGPMVPPPDPYDPPDPQAPFETSDIAVTPHNLTEELA